MDAVGPAIVIAIISSGALSAFVTNWFNRRKLGMDVTHVHVQTALELEQRAYLRYHSATEALEVAQRALDLAREEIHQQELYIMELHAVMEQAGIKPPSMKERQTT